MGSDAAEAGRSAEGFRRRFLPLPPPPRPTLTPWPGLETLTRNGPLDPTPHLARSHLSTRAERKQAGRADLDATDSGAAHPAASWKAARRTFFPLEEGNGEGAGRAAAGAAAVVRAGCAASSGDSPRTTSPRLLWAALRRDPSAHGGGDSYLTEVAPPPAATRRPRSMDRNPGPTGRNPGRDRRLPALGSSSSLPTASSGRPRAAHRHRRVRGAAPGGWVAGSRLPPD